MARIRVYENDKYMDEEAAFTMQDEFSPADALAKCQAIVDDDLREVYIDGISADGLVSAYRQWGRDPVILEAYDDVSFSATSYARDRAATILAECRQKKTAPLDDDAAERVRGFGKI